MYLPRYDVMQSIVNTSLSLSIINVRISRLQANKYFDTISCHRFPVVKSATFYPVRLSCFWYGPRLASFSFILVLSKHKWENKFIYNKCLKWSIEYPVLGFELLIITLLTLPLDQGSRRPTLPYFYPFRLLLAGQLRTLLCFICLCHHKKGPRNGMRLLFKRSWVWIPSPDTSWKICNIYLL